MSNENEKESSKKLEIPETKKYMEPYEIDYDKIKSSMIKDSDDRSNKQRFGFFSIIHANSIGDEYYSQKKVAEKDDNGKIKIPPRGIYAKATKKGKFIDSYFDSSFLLEDKDLREKMTEIAKKEREDLLEKVKKSKDKTENFRPAFLPSGLQGYKDIFDKKKKEYDVPLYKSASKTKNIDFEKRKVGIENRGIFTNPLKFGSWASEGVLFSYDKLSNAQVSNFEKMTKEEIESDFQRKMKLKSDIQNKNFKKAFVPASLKLSTFHSDQELYGLPPNVRENLINSFENRKKMLAKKDYKFAKHDKPFSPASLTKRVSCIIYIF